MQAVRRPRIRGRRGAKVGFGLWMRLSQKGSATQRDRVEGGAKTDDNVVGNCSPRRQTEWRVTQHGDGSSSRWTLSTKRASHGGAHRLRKRRESRRAAGTTAGFLAMFRNQVSNQRKKERKEGCPGSSLFFFDVSVQLVTLAPKSTRYGCDSFQVSCDARQSPFANDPGWRWWATVAAQ